MRAVRLYAMRDLRVEEVAFAPDPGPGEVRITVTAAGICGSDLHNFATGQWITRAPSIAGHEVAGRVQALGAGVTGLALGAPVVLDSRVTCGTCRNCRAGLPQVCEALGFLGEVIDGGFAEALTVPARLVLPAPEGIAPRHLAMAEPLAVALHGLMRLNAPPGAPLLIAGAGSIGGLVALLASRAGHEVAIADRNPARAALVAEMTGGSVADLAVPHPARHALDATGAPEAIAALLQNLSPGGAVALVGIGGRSLTFAPARLVEREMSLIGCHAFGAELPQAIARLTDLAPVLDDLIEAERPLSQAPAAYARHLAGEVAGLKTILRPDLPG